VLFEWDPAKHERNVRERRLGFDEAALIFEGRVYEWVDARKAYGEQRINAVGLANGRLVRLTYTMRGDIIRIVTAWFAGQKDRERWLSDE
jgi:uncharacterized DUF497 family protein